MKRMDLEFTDAEHALLTVAAHRDGMFVEEWVTLAALGMVGNRRLRTTTPSPGRNPRARAPAYIKALPSMVRCPNCGVETRATVSTCDNCEVLL
jgi:hypothetical protein